MRPTSTPNQTPYNVTPPNRAQPRPDGAAPAGDPDDSTAYGVDELIDCHPLDVPPSAATEALSETHAGSAPQESATNIPYRPGQRIIPIEHQPPPLMGDQIVAVNQGPSPDHPLVRLLRSDPGTIIIDYVKPRVDLTATRDDTALRAILHRYNAPKYVNKAMSSLFVNRAETEAIRWLQKLNRFTDDILANRNPNSTRDELSVSAKDRASTRNVSPLIRTEFNIDLRLPHQPHALRRRAEVLAQRLAWCADRPLFAALLRELFEHGSRVQVVDHRMFIDLQHLALSALSAIVRRFTFDLPVTKDMLHQIAAIASAYLSRKQLAVCFAEQVVRDRRKNLQQALVLLDQHFPELPAFRQFVREACLFMNDPVNAPNELRETMIGHLEEEDTSWSPSNVDLIEILAGLVDPPMGTRPLSNSQGIRVQRILIRYMEALNAMHADIHMGMTREHLSQVPQNLLMSAFRELAIHDKLKIAGIILDPYRPNGRNYYLAELNKWLPVIRNVLGDHSIPIEQRQRFVEDLLTELTQNAPGDMSTPAAVELMQLRDDLARIAEYQGN